MGTALFILVASILGFRGLWLLKGKHNQQLWANTAQRLQLRLSSGNLLQTTHLRGEIAEYPIRIEQSWTRNTKITLEIKISTKVYICPRHLWFKEDSSLYDDTFELLPKPLPNMLRQHGLAKLFLLCLSYKQSERLKMTVYSAHIGLSQSCLSFSSPEPVEHPEVISDIIEGLATLANALATPKTLAKPLGQLASCTFAPGPDRLLALQSILEHFPQTDETMRCTWSIPQAEDTSNSALIVLQLLALRHRCALEPEDHLTITQDYLNLRTKIDAALASPNLNLRAIAIESTLSLNEQDATQRLLELVNDKNISHAAIAIRLLPQVVKENFEKAEKILLNKLYQGPSALRVDLICTLGKIGSLESINALSSLESIADVRLRKLCQHSIELLQRRFPRLAKGSLSLLPDDGGLSLIPPDDRNR